MKWQEYVKAIENKSEEIHQRALCDPEFGEAEMFEALDEINLFVLDLYPEVDMHDIPKCDTQTAKDCSQVCEEFLMDKQFYSDKMEAYRSQDIDHYMIFLEQAVLWNQLEDIVYGKGE